MNWREAMSKVEIAPPSSEEYKYQGLIDIVIPVYNDKQGLLETLFSLNIKNHYNIIIVDDCSTEDTYEEVVELFKPHHNIKLVKTKNNGGPAVAKNTGAKYCKNKYITFIDAGDTVVNVNILTQIEKVMEENPHGSFLSCAHYEEGSDASLKYIPPEHNRWMGKVYRKDFFDKNNLQFNEDSSFCNDDIGMNMLARLIATEEKTLHFEEPMIIWHVNPKSVTRKDGYNHYFKENSMGTAKSAVYALQEGRKRFVHPQKSKELICSVISGLYYNYLSTINYRPEFEEEAFAGAQYFYDHTMRNNNIDLEMLTDIYNITTAARLNDEDWEPSLLHLPQLTFIEFLERLENNNA
jgi:glycosyltransferase involved in cell wall biosynthesis